MDINSLSIMPLAIIPAAARGYSEYSALRHSREDAFQAPALASYGE